MHWIIMTGENVGVQMNVFKTNIKYGGLTFYDINMYFRRSHSYSFPAFEYDDISHKYLSQFFIGV